MLALNGYYWVMKCSLQRYVNGIVNVMNKMTPDTRDRCQNLASMRIPVITPFQPLGSGSIMNIHTSTLRSRNLLMKMLTNKRKKKWYETHQSVPIGQPGLQRPAKKNSQDSLRVRTLNTIVYKALSDLMTSYEVNAYIPDYNVEITKVSLSADFSACRVYWKTTWSSEQDSKIQQVLDKSAPRIRYLLITQQILGSVPPLVFMKDKQYAALKEVEHLLEIADYGPSEDSEHLPLSGKDAVTQLHSSEPREERKRPFFGIDHDALHKQIEGNKQRSTEPYLQGTNTPQLTQEQLDALAAIRKQRLIEKKKRKTNKVKDDDITPKAFLLARQLQEDQEEEQYNDEIEREDSQIAQLVEDDNRNH